HTQDCEVLRETSGLKEVEQGGSELALSQVARRAKDDQRHRWRALALTRRERHDAVLRCSRADRRGVLHWPDSSLDCEWVKHDGYSCCCRRRQTWLRCCDELQAAAALAGNVR